VSERERAVGFLLETYRRRAQRVESLPWGELVLTPSLAKVWDANFAVATHWDGPADELQRVVEAAQAAAGFAHRRTVLTGEELAERLWPEISRAGWEFASRYLVMVQRREPDRPPDESIEILGVGEADWASGRRKMFEVEGQGEDPELVRQLLELDRRLAAVMEVRHLAAIVDGEVASFTALYREGSVAQIEDVATLPEHRGRGLARAVVLAAAAEARRAGAELVFLVADADDWPQELYVRLGFDPIGCEHVFGRSDRQHSSA
jgi:ribosomal protein S18 acetylase RimI-like enzyme